MSLPIYVSLSESPKLVRCFRRLVQTYPGIQELAKEGKRRGFKETLLLVDGQSVTPPGHARHSLPLSQVFLCFSEVGAGLGGQEGRGAPPWEGVAPARGE